VLAELGPALQQSRHVAGVAVVPVFAVGRAQALLHAITLLKQRGEFHTACRSLDSPMAVHTTDCSMPRYPQAHRLDAQALQAMRHVATMVSRRRTSLARFGRDAAAAWRLCSASGIGHGRARVCTTLLSTAPDDARNMVVLTGAPGTLAHAAPRWPTAGDTVRIHGHDAPVNAEVVQLRVVLGPRRTPASLLALGCAARQERRTRSMWCMADLKPPMPCASKLNMASNGAHWCRARQLVAPTQAHFKTQPLA
jgi:metallo-beta-lactamase family protein